MAAGQDATTIVDEHYRTEEGQDSAKGRSLRSKKTRTVITIRTRPNHLVSFTIDVKRRGGGSSQRELVFELYWQTKRSINTYSNGGMKEINQPR